MPPRSQYAASRGPQTASPEVHEAPTARGTSHVPHVPAAITQTPAAHCQSSKHASPVPREPLSTQANGETSPLALADKKSPQDIALTLLEQPDTRVSSTDTPGIAANVSHRCWTVALQSSPSE